MNPLTKAGNVTTMPKNRFPVRGEISDFGALYARLNNVPQKPTTAPPQTATPAMPMKTPAMPMNRPLPTVRPAPGRPDVSMGFVGSPEHFVDGLLQILNR
jgi:hypothetical protein